MSAKLSRKMFKYHFFGIGVKEMTPADLGVDVTPKVVVKEYSEPERRLGGRLVADVAELVKALQEEAKAI